MLAGIGIAVSLWVGGVDPNAIWQQSEVRIDLVGELTDRQSSRLQLEAVNRKADRTPNPLRGAVSVALENGAGKRIEGAYRRQPTGGPYAVPTHLKKDQAFRRNFRVAWPKDSGAIAIADDSGGLTLFKNISVGRYRVIARSPNPGDPAILSKWFRVKGSGTPPKTLRR